MSSSWQWSFSIYRHIPPKSYCTRLSFKLNEKSRSRKLETTEDATWIVTAHPEAGWAWPEFPVACGGEEGSWSDVGGGGLGVRVHVQVSPPCPSGAAARGAEPCQGPRPEQLCRTHAALQTQAWKLWVRKVPVVCFCCIQRNKILSTCFVNKPKTFLTPIINFSS